MKLIIRCSVVAVLLFSMTSSARENSDSQDEFKAPSRLKIGFLSDSNTTPLRPGHNSFKDGETAYGLYSFANSFDIKTHKVRVSRGSLQPAAIVSGVDLLVLLENPLKESPFLLVNGDAIRGPLKGAEKVSECKIPYVADVSMAIRLKDKSKSLSQVQTANEIEVDQSKMPNFRCEYRFAGRVYQVEYRPVNVVDAGCGDWGIHVVYKTKIIQGKHHAVLPDDVEVEWLGDLNGDGRIDVVGKNSPCGFASYVFADLSEGPPLREGGEDPLKFPTEHAADKERHDGC